MLGLLVLLVALAGGGYLFWHYAWQPDTAVEDDRVAALAALLAEERAARAAQDGIARAERQQLADDLAAQVQVLANTRRKLADVVDRRPLVEAPVAVPAPSGHWQLAEVEYLLRLANHRLRLERDADGAADLLLGGDEILELLDDPAFHDVRALLAGEVASLRAFEGADVSGLYLRIEAAKSLVDRLPLRLREYTAVDEEAEPGDAEAERSLLEALLARADGLVRFRSHDLDARPPLLAPDEAEYLERHLRLALDRAQLALLRGDQAIFAASLSAADDWLDAFVDPRREAAAALRDELDDLLGADLTEPMPDISASLAKLRELRANANEND